MLRSRKPEILQALSCLLCLAVGWPQVDGARASEFIGGAVTGPWFEMAEYGIVLFLLAAILTIFYRRVATAMAVLATLLFMPFYLYFLAPGPLRRVFRGEYSVPLPTPFAWNTWAMVGVLSLVLTIFVSLRRLATTNLESPPAPDKPDND